MEIEECWSINYSQNAILRGLSGDIYKVRCAERKYSEAHAND